MARWKEGESGNPNGRPKGSKNKVKVPTDSSLKREFKRSGIKGLINLTEYMELYSSKAEEVETQIETTTVEKNRIKNLLKECEVSIEKENSELEEEELKTLIYENPLYQKIKENLKQLEGKIVFLNKKQEEYLEKVFKSSEKLVALADKIVIHNDKLNNKKQGTPSEENLNEEDEDDLEPTVSSTAI